MDKDWLAGQLEAGRSIEDIAREVGRAPSTVAYWVNKHGLTSQHAERHRARGGLTREQLEPLVERGLSIRQIAAELSVGSATVRHWLAKHELKTSPARYGPRGPDKPSGLMRECRLHGYVEFRLGNGGRYRCPACVSEGVSERRRRVKAILVNEAGGACALCGYDRYSGALQFHHRDRSAKSFGLSVRGVTRSLEKLREEARKCVLLCANCHAEVEGGIVSFDPT